MDALLPAEELRRDIAAYSRLPLAADELAVADLVVEFDLADADVDYEALYGAPE